jgi:hypothetical protein
MHSDSDDACEIICIDDSSVLALAGHERMGKIPLKKPGDSKRRESTPEKKQEKQKEWRKPNLLDEFIEAKEEAQV